jgi:hypothetical protein
MFSLFASVFFFVISVLKVISLVTASVTPVSIISYALSACFTYMSCLLALSPTTILHKQV